jgi:hypothetical protein
MKARNEKSLDKDIAIARVEQVQIILFCCKIHLYRAIQILKLYFIDGMSFEWHLLTSLSL